LRSQVNDIRVRTCFLILAGAKRHQPEPWTYLRDLLLRLTAGEADLEALQPDRFVLQSRIPWEMLPQEMGCGSGMTRWRGRRYWQRRGVWKKLLHALLQRVG
jgi:transposase